MAIKSIGIDIREANGLGAGKGRYAEEITHALIKNAPNIKFFLFTKEPNPRFENTDNVHQVVISGSGPLWHLNLRRYLRHHPVNVFLATTSYLYPAISPRTQKVASVVHDLIAFKYAKYNHWFATLVERLSLSRALKRSDLIVTVSRHTWRDLELIKPEAQNKPHVVVTPAIGPEVTRTDEQRLELPKRFILAVGTLQPRKNIEGVIKAFEHVAERHNDLELVIAGGKGWKSSAIFKSIPGWLQERIRFLGYVRYDQLIELYSRAQMLVFPSHYEGFGIPPLEAMACGCPVITSNVSSLPEVVEDAAILVDPEDSDQIAESIKTLLDPTPQRIAKERGLKQAAKFSWDESAQTLLRALNQGLK